MISLRDITKVYPISAEVQVTAVDHLDLSIHDREFLMITGRSGSGKTTLLNLIAGLTQPTSGKICLDQVDLWAMSDGDRSFLRNKKMGFIFQFPSLIPSLTVLENVMLPCIFSNHTAQSVILERSRELLNTVGVLEKQGVYPRQLSAGQQQRVVIARALINQPEILLADEPTSNLDERTEAEIMSLFCLIHAQTSVTVIMITHTSQLIPFSTRAIQIVEGKLE